MIQVKIIPSGEINWSRVIVVSESGEEWDISHLVTTISWKHKAGELPVCTLDLLALKEDGFAPETLTAQGEIVSVVIGPAPTANDFYTGLPVAGAFDVTSMMERSTRVVQR